MDKEEIYLTKKSLEDEIFIIGQQIAKTTDRVFKTILQGRLMQKGAMRDVLYFAPQTMLGENAQFRPGIYKSYQ